MTGLLPPHPLDLAYWTIEGEPKFDEQCFMEDVRKWVAANDPWKRLTNPRKLKDDRLEQLEKAIYAIDRTLRVPAAEYVPAISEVFAIIDGLSS